MYQSLLLQIFLETSQNRGPEMFIFETASWMNRGWKEGKAVSDVI